MEMQDLLSQLSAQESGAYLDYNQILTEALLQRAADAASSMPLALPQWGSTFGTQPRRKPKKKPPKKGGK
jgi:hypothetical protein